MAAERIMIVDDDTNICELLRLYLEKDGYETVIFHDGQSALQSFHEKEPDLVLSPELNEEEIIMAIDRLF